MSERSIFSLIVFSEICKLCSIEVNKISLLELLVYLKTETVNHVYHNEIVYK